MAHAYFTSIVNVTVVLIWKMYMKRTSDTLLEVVIAVHYSITKTEKIRATLTSMIMQ